MSEHMLRAASLPQTPLLENAADYNQNHVRGETRRSNRTRASFLHFSCCVRCRCARLTILLLLCDAQASDFSDESSRLQMLTAEPFGVPWPSECPAARASELATARLAQRPWQPVCTVSTCMGVPWCACACTEARWSGSA